MSERLGRRPPSDYRHFDKFPLSRRLALEVGPTPVVFGIDWHSGFAASRLAKKGNRWFIPSPDKWGAVVGGHAICSLPRGVVDSMAWHVYYNQVGGSCVGYSTARCMTLLNRVRYDAHKVYEQAQLIDEWDDTPPEEGSSVRAGFEILRTFGAPKVHRGKTQPFHPDHGISTYRWGGVDEALAALGRESENAIPLLNSWGRSWPHVGWIENEHMALLLERGGEAGIVSDK